MVGWLGAEPIGLRFGRCGHTPGRRRGFESRRLTRGSSRQGGTRRIADHRILPTRRGAGACGLRLALHEPHPRPARGTHTTVRGTHARLPARPTRRQHRTRDCRRDRPAVYQRASRRNGPRRGERQPGVTRPCGRLIPRRRAKREPAARPPVRGGNPNKRYHQRRQLVMDFRNAPGKTRTCDLRIRSPLLYPAELRGQERHCPGRTIGW
jgi:hypothetical protein